MNYGTLENGTMQPLPKAVRIGGAVVCNPGPADIVRLNTERDKEGKPPYLEEVDERPATTEGFSAVPVGWTRDGDTWKRTYEIVANPPPTLADFDAAMEQHLYDERAARGYTTREPDAYINSSVPRWAQDARDWVAHRDAVMGYALALINAVDDGERDAPTMAEFCAGLPVIQWSDQSV